MRTAICVMMMMLSIVVSAWMEKNGMKPPKVEEAIMFTVAYVLCISQDILQILTKVKS